MYSLIIEYPDDIVAKVGAKYLLKAGMLECNGRYPIRKEDFIFLWHALASRTLCGSEEGFIFTDMSCVSIEDLKDLVRWFNAERYNEDLDVCPMFVNPKRQLLEEHKLFTWDTMSSAQVAKTILQVGDIHKISAYDEIQEPVCFSLESMSKMYAALKRMTRIFLENGDITSWHEDVAETIVSYLGDSEDSVDSAEEGKVTTYTCGMSDFCKDGDCKYAESDTCELKNTRGTEPVSTTTNIARYDMSLTAFKYSYWLYDRVKSDEGRAWTKHTDCGGYCQRVETIYKGLTVTFDCEKLNGLGATLYAAVEVRIKDRGIRETRHYVVYLGKHTIQGGKITLSGNYLSSFVASLGLKTSKSLLDSIVYPTLGDLPDTLFVGSGDSSPVGSSGIRKSSARYEVTVTSGEPYAIVDVEEDKYFDVRWE